MAREVHSLILMNLVCLVVCHEDMVATCAGVEETLNRVKECVLLLLPLCDHLLICVTKEVHFVRYQISELTDLLEHLVGDVLREHVRAEQTVVIRYEDRRIRAISMLLKVVLFHVVISADDQERRLSEFETFLLLDRVTLTRTREDLLDPDFVSTFVVPCLRGLDFRLSTELGLVFHSFEEKPDLSQKVIVIIKNGGGRRVFALFKVLPHF